MRKFIKNSLFSAAQKLLDGLGLVLQNVKMIEQEQLAYLQNQVIRNHELNRTLMSVQN